nr:MAG TPA: hypothetical protein [Caudoviricetes sp.]
MIRLSPWNHGSGGFSGFIIAWMEGNVSMFLEIYLNQALWMPVCTKRIIPHLFSRIL